MTESAASRAGLPAPPLTIAEVALLQSQLNFMNQFSGRYPPPLI